MIEATLDLIDLELNVTKRKRIAKMALRAQEHKADNPNVTFFDAVKKIAMPKTSKEYITFIAGLNEKGPEDVKVWATELLR